MSDENLGLGEGPCQSGLRFDFQPCAKKQFCEHETKMSKTCWYHSDSELGRMVTSRHDGTVSRDFDKFVEWTGIYFFMYSNLVKAIKENWAQVLKSKIFRNFRF